jgi:hypothetical protein
MKREVILLLPKEIDFARLRVSLGRWRQNPAVDGIGDADIVDVGEQQRPPAARFEFAEGENSTATTQHLSQLGVSPSSLRSYYVTLEEDSVPICRAILRDIAAVAGHAWVITPFNVFSTLAAYLETT